MSSSAPSRPWIGPALLAVGIAAHLGLQLKPAWDKTADTPSARDYASYYYAVQKAAQGGDPYDTPGLSAMSRAENTRRTVQPYFYPPPFLLTQLWALPMSLRSASWAMLALNELLLASSLFALRRWYGVSLGAIAVLLATYSPIPDNAWMGQANLLALLPALAGLALAPRRPIAGGILVGTAAMLKMSPALFLLYWAVRRNWRAVGAAVATAVALSVVSLPLVGLATQVHFYRDVLPGFLSGDYHQLTVAISLPANHSIPDIYARMWPGSTPTSMSAQALSWSRATNLGMLALWTAACWRSPGGDDVVADRAALGALTILMTILPVYTYEHHLVFLLLPVGVALTWGLARRSTAARVAAVGGVGVVYFFLAWPLTWLNDVRTNHPAWEGAARESKFYAILAILALLLTISARPQRADRPTA